ncbi:pectinesterase [Ranunculus cassubicifolius]
MGKAAVAVISLILVVGAVIGTVATVKHMNRSGNGGGGGLATGMKAVDTLCSPAEHKDLCKETLAPIAKGDANATPMTLVEAAFNATMKAVNKAFNESYILDKDAKDKYDTLSLGSCKDYMRYSMEELELSVQKLTRSEINSMGELSKELNIWLSAVLAYKSTCIEELENPKLKEAMEDGLINTSKLAENALDIIEGVGNFIEKITNALPSFKSRRLLSTEVGKDGYPIWMSGADRKLLAARNTNLKPNAVVAQDGSGQFKTIQAALNAYPKNFKGRYVIYVKAGVYREYVEVSTKMINVYMYGDGPRKTIVTGDKNFKLKGIPTSKTATFTALGNGFIAKSMGFRNTAGPEGHQAVALLVKSDMSAFYNCRMDGYQDTLYYQALRSFYRNCVISGTVDFIFGRGVALIQNSQIVVRKPLANQFNCVTADGKDKSNERTGLVLQNCAIVKAKQLNKMTTKTYLGRPWGPFATTIIMESLIPDIIVPEGYMNWNETSTHKDTSFYREFANRGPGANTNLRVKWKGFGVITDRRQAEPFTAGRWLEGGQWLSTTGVPFQLGLTR